MYLLAFDSSAKACSAALLKDGSLLGEAYLNNGITHSCTLLCMADDILKNSCLQPEEIDAVAVSAGPGSFTGIRIGMAAAKGIAWGREIPCYGVSTPEAMAFSASFREGIVCACMDARRDQVYNALFRCADGLPVRLCEDRAISVEELKKELISLSEPVFLVGDGAELVWRALNGTVPRLTLAPEPVRHQRASGVAAIAYRSYLSGDRPSAALLTPNYIRPSQAERVRAEKLKQINNNEGE